MSLPVRLFTDQNTYQRARTHSFAADIKALTASSPDIVSQLTPAFEKYNEEQLVTVKLPGSSQPVRNMHTAVRGYNLMLTLE